MVVTLQSACGGKVDRDDDDKKQPPVKTSTAPDGSITLTTEEIQAIGLRTSRITEQAIPVTLDAIGAVAPEPGSEAQVFSPFAGRLFLDPKRVLRIGSTVKKDEVIAQVEQQLNVTEKTQLGANIAQLQANVVQARQEVTFRQTEVDRIRHLYELGGMPLKQLQTAEFNLKQAQAQLDGAAQAKAVYEAAASQRSSGPRRVPITSPISGTVLAVDLTAGQMTDPTKNLLTIANLNSVWVEAPIHESDISAVRKAHAGWITTPASPGKTYSARVITVGDLVDKENRTVQVILAVDNRDHSLKLGMTAQVRIQIGTTARGMLVPASSVLLNEGQPAIYVEIKPQTYMKRRVTLGQTFAGQVAVTSGLSSGESVVTAGAQALLGNASKNQIPNAED